MRGAAVKKLRKVMVQTRGLHFIETFNGLCSVPLRQRLAIAAKIILKRRIK